MSFSWGIGRSSLHKLFGFWPFFSCSWVLPQSIFELFEAWKFGFGPKRGKILWRYAFAAINWALWEERNHWCFECLSSLTSIVVTNSRFLAASWVFVLLEYWGVLMDVILLKWMEVAFSWLLLLWFLGFRPFWGNTAPFCFFGWYYWFLCVFLCFSVYPLCSYIYIYRDI